MDRLGEFYSLNGVADARADVFLARGLTGDDVGPGAAAEGISEVLVVPGPRRWSWCAPV